ncbi:MAG: carbon-nitrogen hydrolase family protein [Betaproteobacteria bacterium]|nr:carbon-nitrogen hydrolase family protein [Betaproteobacteria bacterium]
MNTETASRPPMPHDAKIAAVQMVSGPDTAENLAAAAALVAEAAAGGAELVALPEYFALMGLSERDKIAAREEDAESVENVETTIAPVQEWLSATARRHGVWLVGGTLPLAACDPERIRNSCLVYDPEGKRAARYDKIHLFGFEQGQERYDEAATIEAGLPVPVCCATPLGRIGLSVCYDLRFPELFRAFGTVDLIVVPAAFTETTGQAHWEILLRARAIENQCYLLAAAQGGRHANGRETHGNSMLIDPWGQVLARRDKGPGVVAGAIEHAQIAQVRASLPALRHRVL